MSAPEDREKRTRRLSVDNKHQPGKRRTESSRKTRLEPYDRDGRHTAHVAVEKGAHRIINPDPGVYFEPEVGYDDINDIPEYED